MTSLQKTKMALALLFVAGVVYLAALVMTIATPLGAQVPARGAPARIVVRPLTTLPGDTLDHVDLAIGSAIAGRNRALVVAVVYDAYGAVLSGQRVAWASLAPAIAQISGTTGAAVTVTAKAYGATMLTARVGALEGSTTICVSGKGDRPIRPTPSGVILVPDSTVQAIAIHVDDGSQLAPACVHWSSSDMDRAIVTRRGLVTARTAGPASTITARIGFP